VLRRRAAPVALCVWRSRCMPWLTAVAFHWLTARAAGRALLRRLVLAARLARYSHLPKQYGSALRLFGLPVNTSATLMPPSAAGDLIWCGRMRGPSHLVNPACWQRAAAYRHAPPPAKALRRGLCVTAGACAARAASRARRCGGMLLQHLLPALPTSCGSPHLPSLQIPAAGFSRAQERRHSSAVLNRETVRPCSAAAVPANNAFAACRMRLPVCWRRLGSSSRIAATEQTAGTAWV